MQTVMANFEFWHPMACRKNGQLPGPDLLGGINSTASHPQGLGATRSVSSFLEKTSPCLETRSTRALVNCIWILFFQESQIKPLLRAWFKYFSIYGGFCVFHLHFAHFFFFSAAKQRQTWRETDGANMCKVGLFYMTALGRDRNGLSSLCLWNTKYKGIKLL